MGDNRKRKFQWNNHVKQKCVEAGLSGLFFTCDGHEKEALREAYNLVDEILGERGPATSISTEKKEDDVAAADGSSDEGGDPDEDIADTLKRQCNETVQKQRKEKRCHQRPTGVKNCLFITVKGADVVSLGDRMIELTQASPRCRYLQRVVPVEETTVVGLKEMNDAIVKLVQRHLVVDAEGALPTYALEFKSRNNDQIKKASVLSMLNDAVAMVAPAARVDLGDPKVTFYIQVVRKSILAGVAKNYFSRRKYSMRPKEQEERKEEKNTDEKKDEANTDKKKEDFVAEKEE